jgi:hypothetical protein
MNSKMLFIQDKPIHDDSEKLAEHKQDIATLNILNICKKCTGECSIGIIRFKDNSSSVYDQFHCKVVNSSFLTSSTL